MTAETTAPLQSRSALGLMFDPVFGALFWGKMFAVVAVWTHGIVAAIVMYNATHSALMVGLVGVVQFAPQLILSPTSGKWADTGNPGHVDPARPGVVCRRVRIRGGVVVPRNRGCKECPPALPVLVGTALVGLGFVVGGPAMQSIVPTLIRDGELSTAMALNSIPMTIGRIVGPAAGAYLAAHLGRAPRSPRRPRCIWSSHCSRRVHFPAPPKRAPAPTTACAPPSSTSGETARCCWRCSRCPVGSPRTRRSRWRPRRRCPGWRRRLVGTLSAVFGVGAALGMAALALMGGRLDSARVSSIGLFGLAAGCGVLAIAAVPAVAMTGFALAGLGFGWAMTGLSTVVQERAPEELRSRYVALWLVGFLGSRPIAAALLGGTADGRSACRRRSQWPRR